MFRKTKQNEQTKEYKGTPFSSIILSTRYIGPTKQENIELLRKIDVSNFIREIDLDYP